ncbi:MAG: hypothetical protein F6K26_21975 [Moorea sp. SIO2I5]|nr:hypothetical protein [Moorena sp. SIO2I5]
MSPVSYSRLDAIASGGNPQDRAASLLPTPYSLFPVPYSLFPLLYEYPDQIDFPPIANV